ncbi:hypothetical protein GCM10022393_12080 [Aquimarina addita]|uniref:DUF4468 domain-containing protein n=1 Tax=Aquimarina addita TaxID=870485 RepID=A0ABP7XE55_9FLAO
MRGFFWGFVFCFAMHQTYSQQSVSNYKYVVVPEGYEFLKENDAYQLNSLTKFLFKKYGFTAFLRGEELPEELNANGCLGLTANVSKNSGVFVTKLIVTLKDCTGTIVFTSKEGTSREKEFKAAYHEALRDAFTDVKNLKYVYDGKNTNEEDIPVKPEVVPVPLVEIADSSQIKEVPEKVTAESENSIWYLYNDVKYMLKKQEYGYELFQDKNGNIISIGKIVKSNRENSFIVKAGDLSGNGYFDAYRNFILERINPATDKVITDTFARQ